MVKIVFLMELAGLNGRETDWRATMWLQSSDTKANNHRRSVRRLLKNNRQQNNRQVGENDRKKQKYTNAKSPGAVGQARIESVKKADAAVKTMTDFTSPEVLYQDLITRSRKYHPSTDITMIEKAYEVAR